MHRCRTALLLYSMVPKLLKIIQNSAIDEEIQKCGKPFAAIVKNTYYS